MNYFNSLKYCTVEQHKEWVLFDQRHLQIMYHVLMTGHFKSALEVGCGVSTAAFLGAVEEGKLDRLYLCDVGMDYNACKPAINRSPVRNKIAVYNEDIMTVLPRERFHVDFAFVDDWHAIEHCIPELDMVMEIATPTTLVFHDITLAGPEGFGPYHMFSKLANRDGWFSLLECGQRDGEVTSRGLGLVTRKLEVYADVQPIFKYWNEASSDEVLRPNGVDLSKVRPG